MLATLCYVIAAIAAPPNVVIILSDDQAWTDYGFMKHEAIKTPHLDRLAREGATFTRGYSPISLCRPSLMSIMTGLYPHQHGIVGNDPPKGVDRSKMLKHVHAHATLAKKLADNGYRCLQTGKWWEGDPIADAGFTHAMSHGDPARSGRHGDAGLKIGREGLAPIAKFIDEHGDQPLFVWYAPMLPHQPHTPPERILKKYQVEGRSPHVAKYFAMCEWFDETCGELLAMLEKRGLRENTLVVYVTDNGWIQDPARPQFAPKSKRSPYDGGLRTPIIFRWPGKIEPRRNDATLVSSIDLAPTILTACGIKPDDGLPGVNLLPHLVEQKPIERDTLFGEIYAHDVADIDRPAASLEHRWCIEGNWKLILPQRGSPELYDLASDSHEEKNIAGEQKDVDKRLTGKINATWRPE